VYVADGIVRPAVQAGKVPVALSEEWQAAEFARVLSDHCHVLGVRDRAVLFWNANNPYGFDRIDWPRLAFTKRNDEDSSPSSWTPRPTRARTWMRLSVDARTS
jgi:hypothetical protein